MKGRFPRTAAEFLEHGWRVVANCTACWRASHVEPQALIQMIGADGDVYESFVEIMSKVACHFCEAPISRITISNLKRKALRAGELRRGADVRDRIADPLQGSRRRHVEGSSNADRLAQGKTGTEVRVVSQ